MKKEFRRMKTDHPELLELPEPPAYDYEAL
jgi:hypothetical protein